MHAVYFQFTTIIGERFVEMFACNKEEWKITSAIKLGHAYSS